MRRAVDAGVCQAQRKATCGAGFFLVLFKADKFDMFIVDRQTDRRTDRQIDR